MSLNDDQLQALLAPLHRGRVRVLDGNSHLEAWDIRRWLLRIFGFGGWSGDVLSLDHLYEQPVTLKNGKEGFKVAYRCVYRLTVAGATYTEAAVGESSMPESKRGDAHDMAIKTAESQALKRCAVNLGDCFGLSLYSNGLVGETTVGRSLAHSLVTDHATREDVATGEMDSAVSSQAPESPPVESAQALPAPSPALSPEDGAGATEQEIAETTAAQVAALRDAAIGLLTGTKKNDALQHLTRLQLNASKAKLMNEKVTSPKGVEMTVQVFLNEILNSVSRSTG